MLALERRRKILSIIQEEKSVLVPELSKLFNVTEETIRRDLEKLEKDGYLKRTYGGAVIVDNANLDLPFSIREVTNIEGKNSIGSIVAQYINDGEILMLDSSSTALQVAKHIKSKKNITVITNSEKIVLELSNAKDFNIISTGGTFKSSSFSYIGHLSEKAIQNYNADKAIISCKGISIDKGITDSNEMEAEIKKAMINSSNKVFLAVDYTKFNKASFVKMMDIKDIDMLFTDNKLSLDWEDKLRHFEVQVIYC